MRFRLDELQKGKEVVRDIDLEREEIQIASGTADVHNLKAQLKFRIDPMGYVVKYSVCAEVICACVRCAENLQLEVDKTDWISLRVQQPEEGHILLDNSELNVRFITDTTLDLTRLALEIVELELPTFPRHPEDTPSCLTGLEGMGDEEERSSPFDGLSKLL